MNLMHRHKLIIQDKKTRSCTKPDPWLITLYVLLTKQTNDPVSQTYYLLNQMYYLPNQIHQLFKQKHSFLN